MIDKDFFIETMNRIVAMETTYELFEAGLRMLYPQARDMCNYETIAIPLDILETALCDNLQVLYTAMCYGKGFKTQEDDFRIMTEDGSVLIFYDWGAVYDFLAGRMNLT